MQQDLVSEWAMVVRGTTPAFVYSLPEIERTIRAACNQISGARVAYAMKANPLQEIVHVAKDAGLNIEIASLGEFQYARSLGIPASTMMFAGPGKTKAEVDFVMSNGIGVFHAESVRELEIARGARNPSSDSVVALRVNPLQGAGQTIENMTGGPSRFGLDEELIRNLGRRLRPDGYHLYQASQIMDWREVVAGVTWLRDFATEVGAEGLTYLNFGGGFGVPLEPRQAIFDLLALGRWWGDNRATLAGVDEHFELGRFLVADAGVLFLEVREVKQSRGETFVVCDGGINVFLRPVLTGQAHPISQATGDPVPFESGAIVTGPLCTPLDEIGRMQTLPQQGDLIAVRSAGAYGPTLSPGHFLGHPTASEWVVRDSGEDPVMVRRNVESLEYLAMGRIQN